MQDKKYLRTIHFSVTFPAGHGEISVTFPAGHGESSPTFPAGHGEICPPPPLGDPRGDPQTSPQHAHPHGFLVWCSLKRHQVHVDRLWAGLRVAMWITHVLANFAMACWKSHKNLKFKISPKTNSSFRQFYSLPPAMTHPLKKLNSYFYCRLAVSETRQSLAT